jgi:glutamate N-acetyltransferase/amino-acid N-acetyltransferase
MAVGESELPVLLPVKGVLLGVAEAGIKYPQKKDLVVIELTEGSECVGVFTQNAFCAAPVTLTKQHLARQEARYLLINTGNANAGTGQQGLEDARLCCRNLAERQGIDAEQVLPFSTGVIGEKLPTKAIVEGIPAALQDLSVDNWLNAAQGIMTTDTRPKGTSVRVSYGGEDITITGISKGAGMIRPNMATMLGFIATDATISRTLLQQLVSDLADKSFNRITIDGDTSTNDSCMLIATGQSGAEEIVPGHADFESFVTALEKVFITLAQAIVRDGEGATKFVTVRVERAASREEALNVGYTIAHSPLIKTALFASDPNWGRILAALGRSGIKQLDLDLVDIYLGDVRIVKNGERDPEYTEVRGKAVMVQEDILIRIVLNRGDLAETIWTTDLSHDYVTINAEYRT